MKITIVIGDKPAGWSIEAVEHWLARAKHYTDIEIQCPSGDERKKTATMIKLAGRGNPSLALTRTGEIWNSEKWRKNIAMWQSSGLSPIFFIGSADGLPSEVMNLCRAKISLSPLTFQHDLTLIILLEQLYRHLSFLAGHPYHRGE